MSRVHFSGGWCSKLDDLSLTHAEREWPTPKVANIKQKTRQGGHLRPQNAVTYDHKHLSRILGHLWPQSAVTYDHRTSYSLTGSTKPPQCMGSLVTTECGHLRPQNTFTTEQQKGVGWGGWGWDDNVPWLADRHAERWSGLPALGLHTCWPILVGGGGVGGMITYHKALLQYYSALQSTTPYYKVLLESTTPVPLFTTKYNSSTTLYYSSTTPHQTLCSGCLPKFQPMLRLPTKVTLQHHQIMRLPQEVKLQHDQILRLPRKVTL